MEEIIFKLYQLPKNPKMPWAADIKNKESAPRGLGADFRKTFSEAVRTDFISENQNSRLLTVLGKGTTSRMLPMPVTYMIRRSKPRPKPPCLTVP